MIIVENDLLSLWHLHRWSLFLFISIEWTSELLNEFINEFWSDRENISIINWSETSKAIYQSLSLCLLLSFSLSLCHLVVLFSSGEVLRWLLQREKSKWEMRNEKWMKKMWNERMNDFIDLICILMLILGTIGNILGLIVFSSEKFRRTRYGRIALISFLINFLCVFRYSLLIHSKTRLWITYNVGQSWFLCKFYRFSSCLRILSSFILVTWTYERFIYVTNHCTYSMNNSFFAKYKFYFLTFIFFLIIGGLTGPNVYFYHQISRENPFFSFNQSNSSFFNQFVQSILFQIFISSSLFFRSESEEEKWRWTSDQICGLKQSISSSWQSFLIDVRFGFNYTTLRSIFSELIPSIFVLIFDIGIISHVIQSNWTMSMNSPSTSSRPSFRNSFQSKEIPLNGMIVYNRPRTSWMNIALIIHSVLFCFSSLTSTMIHWTTSNVLFSYWSSVLILGNSAFYFYIYCLTGKSFRNEIRKIFYRYLQLYFIGKCLDLCRTKQQRELAQQTIHLRLLRHRSTIIPAQSIAHLRRPSTYFS